MMTATAVEPQESRPRRKADRDHLASAQEMVRLLDGKAPTMRSLAIVCGVSLATISRWVEAARETMPPAEVDDDTELSPEDRVYFAKRYANSADPDVRAWLASINTPLRRRP